jgi:DNA-binding NarL/FixJ family response regulator
LAATPQRGEIRVVIADDDFLLREGIASVLENEGFTVVGKAANPEELLALVREHRPELAVVDIRMPPTHTTEGIDAATAIRGIAPETGILLLSAYLDLAHAVRLVGTGQRIGYLLKSRVVNEGELVDALNRVQAGEVVIDPVIVEALIGHVQQGDPLAALTPRERNVLSLMAEGCSNLGIAHRLSITESAVEKHIRGILGKLDLPHTEEAHRRVLAVLTYLESR